MVAAKVKTVNFKSGSNIEPMGNNLAHPTAAKTPSTVVNRISSYDFRTRKFKKSPIGSIEKIHLIVAVENQQRPRKYVGENDLQLRRLHWAPELSLYRGYFVPRSMDPTGNGIVSKVEIPCGAKGLAECRLVCRENDEVFQSCKCYKVHEVNVIIPFVWATELRYKMAVPKCEDNEGDEKNGCTIRPGSVPPTKPGGCWLCKYHCKGTRYPQAWPVERWSRNGCPAAGVHVKWATGYFTKKQCEEGCGPDPIVGHGTPGYPTPPPTGTPPTTTPPTTTTDGDLPWGRPG